MEADQFLQMALQWGRDRDLPRLLTHVRSGLLQSRSTVVPLLSGFLSHSGEDVRTVVFEAMVSDGGVDLMPLLLQMFQATQDEGTLEKRLALLAEHPRREALDLVDALKSILGPAREASLRRTHSKLRARFRQYYYEKQFEQATGVELESVVAAMVKRPHEDYLAPMNAVLLRSDPEHCREAARVLLAMNRPASLSFIEGGVKRTLERYRVSEFLVQLPFLWGDVKLWSVRTLMRAYADHPELPLGLDEAEKMAQYLAKGATRADADTLLNPFDLDEPILSVVRKRVMCLLLGSGTVPSDAELKDRLEVWQDQCLLALRQLVFTGSRIAKQTETPGFDASLASLLPEKGTIRQIMLVCFHAGQGDEEGARKLSVLLQKSGSDLLTRTILELLVEVPLDWIPDEVLNLARDSERHAIRGAAIKFLAQSPLGQAVLETLLVQGSLTVKEDVGACIAANRLIQIRPFLVGLLGSQVSDSFRLILMRTLEAFDGEETGLPVRTFLGSTYSLPVRLAALHTLVVAGGPERFQYIADVLENDSGTRHRDQVQLAFLDMLAQQDADTCEGLLLGRMRFVGQLLQSSTAAVRENALLALERFSWEDPRREGWIGILQKAIQTLINLRSPDEVERIRAIIQRVSARFESERKVVALKRRLDTIVIGLKNPLRLERFQALKQLDWIFRPEMISGDPAGVKRLVTLIEKVLETDEGDSTIEILALEVAGKIGHPALRKKIKEYLDHPDPDVSLAAERALRLPVSQALLANLIKTVFHIDDSFYMTRMVGSILSQEGYEADGANGPEESIQFLQHKEYDLLVLDLNMPKMRGVDFLKKIRGLGLAPRFTFVLTSVRTEEELVEVFKEGVDGVLLKPFRAEELVEKIRELKERCS